MSGDVSQIYNRYVNNPSKQVNLGWTVVSLFYVLAVFVGLFLVAMALVVMCTNPSISQGQSSKKPMVIVAYIGLGLVIYGVWSTVQSFYTIVAKINSNIRNNGECSLFVPDTAIDAARLLVAEGTLDLTVRDAVESRRNAALNIQPLTGYNIYENTSSLSPLLPKRSPQQDTEGGVELPATVSDKKLKSVVEKLQSRVSEGRGSDTDKDALAILKAFEEEGV
jgi:hypothetical protein